MLRTSRIKMSVAPTAPGDAIAGRIFAPADEQNYVFVPTSREAILCIPRDRSAHSGGAPVVRAMQELSSLVGPADRRAKSCAIFAFVGLISFADERYIVVVLDSAARKVATPSGWATVCVKPHIPLPCCEDGSARASALPRVSLF